MIFIDVQMRIKLEKTSVLAIVIFLNKIKLQAKKSFVGLRYSPVLDHWLSQYHHILPE